MSYMHLAIWRLAAKCFDSRHRRRPVRVTKKNDIRACLDIVFFCYLCGLKTHRKNIVLAQQGEVVKTSRYSFALAPCARAGFDSHLDNVFLGLTTIITLNMRSVFNINSHMDTFP